MYSTTFAGTSAITADALRELADGRAFQSRKRQWRCGHNRNALSIRLSSVSDAAELFADVSNTHAAQTRSVAYSLKAVQDRQPAVSV